MLLVASLRWSEPLESCAVLCGVDPNAERELRAGCLAMLVVQVNRQRATIWLDTILVQLPLYLVALYVYP